MSRSAKNDKTKTNVMRLLDAAKIPYEAKEYPVDEKSGAFSLQYKGLKHASMIHTQHVRRMASGEIVLIHRVLLRLVRDFRGESGGR